MSISKFKIKFNNRDSNIQIDLNRDYENLGYQEEINSFTNITSNANINDVVDGEITRCTYISDDNRNFLYFNFYNSNSDSYSTDYTFGGFTNNEINNSSSVFLNSFFIVDIFDTDNIQNQTKIISTYLTKLNFNFDGTAIIPLENINMQLNKLNIPFNNIDDIESDDDYYYLYLRFSFYNAKTGKITLFHQDNRSSYLKPSEQVYFKVKIGKNDKRWVFNVRTFNTNTLQYSIIGKEFKDSQAFIDRLNNTVDNTQNLKLEYPTGDTFNYDDASYS